MKPLVLRLDARVYSYLFRIHELAVNIVFQQKTAKTALPHIVDTLIVSEMRLPPPETLIFPKTGKTVRFTLAQCVCLQKSLLKVDAQNSLVYELSVLLGTIDLALTNYHPVYGYKQPLPARKRQLHGYG